MADAPTVLQVAAEALRVWRHDAVRFVRDVFGAEPDLWQQDVLRAWCSPEPKKRIAEKACVGPGKTTTEAWCGWHGMLTMSDGIRHPNGNAVAINGDNLKNNLWKELSFWRDQSPLLTRGFEMTSERIFQREHRDTWFLMARTFKQDADAEALGRTLSGLHADAVFYLLDESGDMPPAIGRSAEQGFSSAKWARILQGGNPSSMEGLLYHAVANQASLWTVIEITGDPDDPRRSQRIDAAWASEQIALYSRDNPWIMYAILGKFPPAALNALLSVDEVREAMAREHPPEAFSHMQRRLGIDPARFGNDRTVLFPRQGLVAHGPVVLRGASGTKIGEAALTAKRLWGWKLCLVDATGGWGQSALDFLIAAGEAPVDVQFHTPALHPKYANRRAESWWEMAQWIKRGGQIDAGNHAGALVEELTKVTYSYKNGQLLLIPKEILKKQLGRSPDLADALALTFALPDVVDEDSLPGMRQLMRSRMQSEYDPYRQTEDARYAQVPAGMAADYDPYR